MVVVKLIKHNRNGCYYSVKKGDLAVRGKCRVFLDEVFRNSNRSRNQRPTTRNLIQGQIYLLKEVQNMVASNLHCYLLHERRRSEYVVISNELDIAITEQDLGDTSADLAAVLEDFHAHQANRKWITVGKSAVSKWC